MANLLFITAKEAKDLKKVQLIGRQDPYLKLWVGRGGTKVKTKVHNDGSSKASWDETFAFDLEPVDPSEYLYFEVKNKNMTDSKPIGMGKVPLKTFSMALTKAWHDTYDSKGKPAGKVLLEGRVESKKYSSSSSSHHHATGASGRNALRNPNDGGGATHLSYPGQHQQQPSYGLQQAGAPRPIHNTNNPYSISSGTASDHDYRRPSHTTNGSSYAATIPGASSHSAHALARPLPSAASPNAIYYADPSSSSKYGGPAATASSPYGLHAAGVANGAGVSSCGGSINPNVSPYNPSMPASNGGGGAGGYSVPTGPGASFSPSAPSAPPAGDVGSAYGFVAPLPGGWEEKMTPEGRRFYVDHRTKTTSWVRPV